MRPPTAIRKTALSVGHCLCVIDHHGYEVPVVDTQAAIGLGMGEPQALTPVIVIRFANDALLGFAIDEVHDIVRVAAADIVAMPLLARGEAALFRGMIADGAERRDSLVLNAAALRADPNLVMLGAGETRRMVSQVDLVAELTAFYGPAAERVVPPAAGQDVSAAVA